LTRQTLRRVEEPGFEAEHRVPMTAANGTVLKKPAKRATSALAEGRPAKRRFYR